jgi:hypothetical protein
MHIETITRYPSGKLWTVTYYKNGIRDGMHRIWYENGKLRLRCLYVDGKLNGAMTEWYPNGYMRAQRSYLDGTEHGVMREWNEDGKIVFERIWPHDEPDLNELAASLRLRSIDANEIISLNDRALRRICMDEIGYEMFYAQLEHVLIDKDGEDELVMIDWHADEEPLCLVKVKCHSTGTFYTLRVPPAMRTVKEAISWTFNMTEEAYLLDDES